MLSGRGRLDNKMLPQDKYFKKKGGKEGRKTKREREEVEKEITVGVALL